MKKTIIIFSLVGLVIAVSFPVMEEFISYEETVSYCEDCFRPFWNYISINGWFIIFIYSILGVVTGGLTGFLVYKLKRFVTKYKRH